MKADQRRLVLHSVYLNDNALLEYVTTFGHVEVVVRFVESTSTIKEHILLKMDTAEYMKNKDHLIEINSDQTAVAVFMPTIDGYVLNRIYDAEMHEFGQLDFLDVEYKEKFPGQRLEKQFFKTKQ